MVDILLLSGLIIVLGVYNWNMNNRIQDLEEQIDSYNDLVLSMAEELQELGSPNVKVVEREK
jgi:cell division protein FtsL